MSQLHNLSINNQASYRWSIGGTRIISCASKMQIDVPANSGFSKQQVKYFITPPCNYKLR